MKNFLVALVALAAVALLNPTDAISEEGWIVKPSPHSVADTADKLVAAIENAGAKVVARVDHAASAKQAGMDLSPTTLVIFGNPKLGTPIMQANQEAGLDLPVRMLIWSKDGQTMLGALDPQTLKARYTLEGADESLQKMRGALEKLMAAAAE